MGCNDRKADSHTWRKGGIQRYSCLFSGRQAIGGWQYLRERDGAPMGHITGQLSCTLGEEIRGIAYSSDSRLIAVAQGYNTIRVFQTGSNKEVHCWEDTFTWGDSLWQNFYRAEQGMGWPLGFLSRWPESRNHHGPWSGSPLVDGNRQGDFDARSRPRPCSCPCLFTGWQTSCGRQPRRRQSLGSRHGQPCSASHPPACGR